MSDNEITLFGRFWPSLWYIDQGGNVHLDLAVTFAGDIPNNYDYQIDFKDYAGNIAKTWTGTKSTEGQAETQLNIAWDGRNEGQKIPTNLTASMQQLPIMNIQDP